MTARARGADFASYQDLAAVDAAIVEHHLDFAFVKLTEGAGYVNPLAREQLEHCRTHGLSLGVYHYLTHYHYLTAPSGGTPLEQWRHFAAELVQLHFADELLVCLDYEAAGATDAEARAFIRAGKRAGWKVGLYSSAGTHAYKRLGQRWRWVAQWGEREPARSWAFWQFSNGGGRQDWDVFHGDRAKLARFMAANAGRGRIVVTFPGKPTVRLGPFRRPRAAALHALAYALRHPKRTSYTIARR